MGFPGGSDGEESTGNSGNLESIPGLGRSPGEGNSYSLQYSGLENFHELYSLWGHKESDSTERILTLKMQKAVENQEFESAIILRERLKMLEKLKEKNKNFGEILILVLIN